jgi:hypothetical protein
VECEKQREREGKRRKEKEKKRKRKGKGKEKMASNTVGERTTAGKRQHTCTTISTIRIKVTRTLILGCEKKHAWADLVLGRSLSVIVCATHADPFLILRLLVAHHLSLTTVITMCPHYIIVLLQR